MAKFRDNTVSLMINEFDLGDVTISSQYSDFDLNQLEVLNGMVNDWCVNNRLLVLHENILIPNVGNKNELSRLTELILTLNIKSLTVESTFREFVQTFVDTRFDYTISRMVDLLIDLMVILDSEFFNRYVNKLKYSLEVMSSKFIYNVEPVYKTWDELFDEYPIIPVIHAIQRILKSNVIMPQ